MSAYSHTFAVSDEASNLRILIWGLAALASAIGCYVGLFWAAFPWWYSWPGEGPVPLTGKLEWTALGMVIVVGALLLGRWSYRNRPWLRPNLGTDADISHT